MDWKVIDCDDGIILDVACFKQQFALPTPSQFSFFAISYQPNPLFNKKYFGADVPPLLPCITTLYTFTCECTANKTPVLQIKTSSSAFSQCNVCLMHSAQVYFGYIWAGYIWNIYLSRVYERYIWAGFKTDKFEHGIWQMNLSRVYDRYIWAGYMTYMYIWAGYMKNIQGVFFTGPPPEKLKI